MGIISRIVIGLLVAGIGVFIVMKTHLMLDIFGASDLAEQKLGRGGSNLMYKLVGLIFIMVGFLMATNLWNDFLGAIFGSFLPQTS